MIDKLISLYEGLDTEFPQGISGYSEAPLLSDTDYALVQCLKPYDTLGSPEKKALRKALSEELAGFLLVFAERIAGYLLNEKDETLFHLGLHTLDACMEKGKSRDIFMVLSLFHDIYIRHLFVFADFLSSDEPIGKTLRAFLARDSEAKSIEAMGYIIEHNALGQILYKRREMEDTHNVYTRYNKI